MRIETNVEWIRGALIETKGLGVYKKLTWVNFTAIFGMAFMMIKEYFKNV